MNSPKNDPLQVTFERTLGRMLKNWSQRNAPPREGRALLMVKAGEIQARRVKGLQGLLHHRDYIDGQPREMFSLFYAPQMSYVIAWINF